jgi:hypothetical protein
MDLTSFRRPRGRELGLIVFLVWASPCLGRYQRPVLLAAAAAGIVGALSNLISLPIVPI